VNKKIKIFFVSVLFSIVLWISISLSNEYFTTIAIPVKVVNFPRGYTNNSGMAKNISIKLKGEGWKLISVNLGTKTDYTVSAGQDSGRKTVNLYNYLAENQWLSSDIEVIDISPDTLSFLVEKISDRKVKIIPDLNLNFKPGYGLASSIKIKPDSIIVHGPKSYIENLNTIQTEEIKFSEMDSKVIHQVFLKEIDGMVYDVKTVSVEIDVQKIVDKNFFDIPVSVLDMPEDRDVVLIPKKIGIGLRGGIEILSKVTNENISAYLYYRDVVLDTIGSVVPKIELPADNALLYTKPERLRYIIKKY
jgi:hypothetical protein